MLVLLVGEVGVNAESTAADNAEHPQLALSGGDVLSGEGFVVVVAATSDAARHEGAGRSLWGRKSVACQDRSFLLYGCEGRQKLVARATGAHAKESKFWGAGCT